MKKRVTLSESKLKDYSLLKKTVKDALKRLKGLGIKDFIFSFIYDAWLFAEILICLLFFPRIRKKYELTKKKVKQFLILIF